VLPEAGALLVISSTYNGTPPDNAAEFARWLPKQAEGEGTADADACVHLFVCLAAARCDDWMASAILLQPQLCRLAGIPHALRCNTNASAQPVDAVCSDAAAAGSLSKVMFSVFGVGNSQWAQTYQAFPTQVALQLARAGATQVTLQLLRLLVTWCNTLYQARAAQLWARGCRLKNRSQAAAMPCCCFGTVSELFRHFTVCSLHNRYR
jgi:DNA-binding transcriptional regulator YdaS (Cro superfamily)